LTHFLAFNDVQPWGHLRTKFFALLTLTSTDSASMIVTIIVEIRRTKTNEDMDVIFLG